MYFILRWVSFIGSLEIKPEGRVHADPNAAAPSVSLLASSFVCVTHGRTHFTTLQTQRALMFILWEPPGPAAKSPHQPPQTLVAAEELLLTHSQLRQTRVTLRGNAFALTHHFFSGWLVR